MAQTYLKSAIKMLPISIILISVPPLPSINALDAFEIEYSKFNFANIELILDPASMFNINISTVEIEKEGKYGFESKLATFQGKLCIPKYEYSGFKDGCSSGDYSVCKKHKKLVAMVPRAECDLYEMAEYARQQSVLGLIIVETSATTEAADLKEYDQSPHKFSTYKTTSLDHSFIRENTRKREAGIPFILCTKTMGTDLQAFVKNGSQFIIKVSDGGIHGTELRVPSSSLLLVFVAFIVLTIISMIWLIFYYVQRFRYHHHQDRVIGQVRKATKKAFRMMPTKILREGDPELEAAFGRCAICLEAYKLWDMVRELPCSHIYHKSCVDAWLSRKPACPHCKSNVLKALGFDADYDWTCLDANSEPDAISLLDIVPQVVSVQIFAPNTAAPSRFITELTSIPHNPPANTGDQATALGSSSASAPSSPNQSNYRANNKQQPSTNNQQSNKRNSSSANDNGNNGNQGVTVRTTVSTTTAVATVEMSATSPQITASAKPPAARPKNKASKSGPGSNSVPATGGVGGGVGNRGGTSESSTPMNVALEVETHNHGPSSTSSGSTGAGGTAVSKTSPPLTLSSSGPSSNTSANSAASAAGKSRKRNKKATLSKKAISGDSKA